MKILITNNALTRLGGTQSIVRDLALGLQRRGHSVLAYRSLEAPPGNSLADDLVPITSRLGFLSFAPDVIHAHHHTDAMTAIMALPGIPAVYSCHGATWSEKQPCHPRILRYVAMTPTLRLRMASESGIDEAVIDVIYNAVDLRRFGQVREPPARLARAAVYNRVIGPDSPVGVEIRKASDRAGLRLEFLANAAKAKFIPNPEDVLPAYDIVFASGKSAIEALACGCAVIVLGGAGCGEMVDEANFDRLRRANFSIPVNSPPPSAARILAEINRYSAAEVAATTSRLRREADFEHYIDRFVALYEEIIGGVAPDPHAEQRAASRYLRSIVPWIRPFDALPNGHWRPLETGRLREGVAGQLEALAGGIGA